MHAGVFWRNCSYDIQSFKLPMKLLCLMPLVGFVALQVLLSGLRSPSCHCGQPINLAKCTNDNCVKSLQCTWPRCYLDCFTELLSIRYLLLLLLLWVTTLKTCQSRRIWKWSVKTCFCLRCYDVWTQVSIEIQRKTRSSKGEYFLHSMVWSKGWQYLNIELCWPV